ncbi:MAG: MgtC/SapB family protein, partial [Clostridia bacterium]|nr:MgtC/SapB family protein [Clostridia bacterium]
MDFFVGILGDWSGTVNVWSILFRIFVSLVFSSVIGCERATKRHAAGLRTFIVVALAFTTAGIVDATFTENYGGTFPVLSACAVIGAAIIGSNSILFSSKNQIKGLTTSVGLWACGLLGMSAGLGFYTLTAIGFVALMVSLSFFPKIEIYLKNRSNYFEVHLELENKSNLKDFV